MQGKADDSSGLFSALGERGPGQQQSLLANTPKVHNSLSLVSTAEDAGDHSIAELAVTHIVTDLQTDLISAALGWRWRLERGLDGLTTA